MKNIYNDNDYLNLIEDILYNKEFQKIDSSVHHGQSRLDHCLRVSYYSYKVSKKLLLNYEEVARAGLLHDFFVTEDLKGKEKMISTFVHPKKALENSNKNFHLSDKEANIIEAHMFPLVPNKVPKYMESWVVSAVDKVIAMFEFGYSYGAKAICRLPSAYLLSLLLIFRL